VTALVVVGAAGLAPAAAQEDGGTLAAVTYWTIAPGTNAQFEAGLKAHNQLHADQGDPVPLLTWTVISGPRAGQYGRGSFGHVWSDFDVDADNQADDVADSAVHITPYLRNSEATIWDFLPSISRSADGPGNLSRIFEFHLHPGHEQAFMGAISEIHAVLSERDRPPYDWYALVDGGEIPTLVVGLPRDNWASMAPPDPDLGAVMAEALGGEKAAMLWETIGKATRKQLNYTLAFRPDLSYMPSSGE
jgi:hypothetical protein